MFFQKVTHSLSTSVMMAMGLFTAVGAVYVRVCRWQPPYGSTLPLPPP